MNANLALKTLLYLNITAKNYSLKLSNQYYGIRHGESEANIEKIISSNSKIGLLSHGLTENGCQQSYNASSIINSIINSNNINNKSTKSLDSRVFLASMLNGAVVLKSTANQEVLSATEKKVNNNVVFALLLREINNLPVKYDAANDKFVITCFVTVPDWSQN
jgi:hypothetical protein